MYTSSLVHLIKYIEQESETKIKEEPTEAKDAPKSSYREDVPVIKVLIPNPVSAPHHVESNPQQGYFNRANVAIPPPTFYNEHEPKHSLAPPPPPPAPPRQSQDREVYHVSPRPQNRENYQYAPPPPPPPPPRRSPSPSRSQHNQYQHSSGFPSIAVKNLAAEVAERGDQVEEMTRVTNKDSLLW